MPRHCLGSVCAFWLSKFAYLEYAGDYKADLNTRHVGRPNVSHLDWMSQSLPYMRDCRHGKKPFESRCIVRFRCPIRPCGLVLNRHRYNLRYLSPYTELICRPLNRIHRTKRLSDAFELPAFIGQICRADLGQDIVSSDRIFHKIRPSA